jgi:hypothetical protein
MNQNNFVDPGVVASLTPLRDNYNYDMQNQYDLEDDEIVKVVTIPVSDIQDLLAKQPDAKAIRAYMVKDTNDANKDDFRLIIVPCVELTDENTQKYYQDVVKSEYYKKVPDCRRPPGCKTKGCAL